MGVGHTQMGIRRIATITSIAIIAVILVNPVYLNVSAQSQKVPVIILFKEKVTGEDNNQVQSNGGEITRTYHIINGLAVKLPQDKIEAIKNDPRVASVDPDVEVHAFDLSADTQIRADQVWAKGDTGTGVPVAILDTGIDTTHPEFSGRILKCHSEITNTNTCTDGNGHGTHTAGIAGAAGINLSAKGVAPAVSLYSDQVLDSTGSGTISGVIAGIDWATTNNAKVISMSLGTSPLAKNQPNCDTAIPSLTTAINNTVGAGVTVVAAAGNSGRQGVGAPGCISSTITVGAVDSTDTIASFSSTGGPLADHGIVAPGVNIYSTVPTGSCQLCDPSGYLYLSGTSMATPHVAGTIALMIKANPGLSPATIRSTLFNTACTSTTSPSCPTGTVPNSVYGYGRVDALRAYNAVATPPSSTTTTVASSLNPSTFGQSVTFTATVAPSAATGTVTFSIDGTAQPPATLSGGTATFSTTSLAVGSHSITATYSGDSSFGGSTSSVLTQTVTAPPSPDFSLSATSVTVQQGSSGTSTVAITPSGGFNSGVNLSLSGNPSGVSGSFSPNPATTSSTLTLTVGSSVPAGSYTLTVTGTSGSLTHTTTLTLTVSAPPPPPGSED
jgi:subtilisin family serine protease